MRVWPKRSVSDWFDVRAKQLSRVLTGRKLLWVACSQRNVRPQRDSNHHTGTPSPKKEGQYKISRHTTIVRLASSTISTHLSRHPDSSNSSHHPCTSVPVQAAHSGNQILCLLATTCSCTFPPVNQ